MHRFNVYVCTPAADLPEGQILQIVEGVEKVRVFSTLPLGSSAK